MYFLLGTFIHVKHRSKDVLGDIDSLMHFIDITTESTGKSDQVLLLSSPLDDITRHAWKVSQIRQFRITDLGVCIEFCPNCYKTHTPQHRSFNLFIKSSEINICVEFLCRKTNARAVAESLDNYITIYKIQDHHCRTPDPPTTSPPPPLPTKRNIDRPPMPPRIHPRFGYLNGAPAEPYAAQTYSRMKQASSVRLCDMVSPYKITSRIVINNDGSVSHESTVLGHLGGRMDRPPITPMRKSRQANDKANSRHKRSTKKHQDLQNSIFLLPPKNVPRPRCPSPILTPIKHADDVIDGDYENINGSDEDYENEWCPSAPSDPVQRHKPLSYIEPVSLKENLAADDDVSGDYINVPEVVDSVNTTLDYINIPDCLNVTDSSNTLDSSASTTLDSSTVNTLDSATFIAQSESPTQEVESDSDANDNVYINVTEILKEISPPLPLAAPTPTVRNPTIIRPIIKRRTLKSMNSKSNLMVFSKPDPTTKVKVTTPSDALSKPVSGVPSPKPRKSLSKVSKNQAVSFHFPSVPSKLESVTLKSSEQASNASCLIPDKASTVTPSDKPLPKPSNSLPKVSPKPVKKHHTTISRHPQLQQKHQQQQEHQQQEPVKGHQTIISKPPQLQQKHQQQQEHQQQELVKEHQTIISKPPQLQQQHQQQQENQVQQPAKRHQTTTSRPPQPQQQHQQQHQLQQPVKKHQTTISTPPQLQQQYLQQQENLLQQHEQLQQQQHKESQEHQELQEHQLQQHLQKQQQQHYQQEQEHLHEQQHVQKNKQQQPKVKQLQQQLQKQQQHLQTSQQQQQQQQQQHVDIVASKTVSASSISTQIIKKPKTPPSAPRRTCSLALNVHSKNDPSKSSSSLTMTNTVAHIADSLQHKPEQHTSSQFVSDAAYGSFANQPANQTKRKKKVPLPTPKATSQPPPEGNIVIGNVGT